MTSRPVSRVAIVLPHASPMLDALTDALATELHAHGVHVVRMVEGASVDVGVRADTALWWQGADGQVPVIDRTAVHARIHAILLDDATKDTGALSAADAVCVVHESLAEQARLALGEAGAANPHVTVAKLPLAATSTREIAKGRHHVSGHAVVLIDLTNAFERDIERVMIQLALVNAPHVRVIHVPHDERARARTRELAARHGVDAYLTSGPHALSSALAAADLFVGRPEPRALLFAAAHGVAVTWLDGEGDARPAMVNALVTARTVSTTEGVLHLAATLERRLADRGGVDVEGTLLRAALVGEARSFLDAIGRLREHASAPRGNLAWEAIGPSREEAVRTKPVVDARAPGDEIERAARIEDALRLLKERVREGGV